jgi:transposase
MTVYGGMDLHRTRSQVAVVDEAGNQQRNRDVANDPAKLIPILGTLPPGTRSRSRPLDGWSWLVELLEELELDRTWSIPAAANQSPPPGCRNDKLDAHTIGAAVRADLLPEAWIAPQQVRDLRALLRHRAAALVRLSTLPQEPGSRRAR